MIQIRDVMDLCPDLRGEVQDAIIEPLRNKGLCSRVQAELFSELWYYLNYGQSGIVVLACRSPLSLSDIIHNSKAIAALALW